MKNSIPFFIFLFSFFSFFLLNAQTWEEQAIGILPSNYGIFDISVVDENIVWAVAFDQNTGNGIPFNHVIKVIKTIDGGDNWESYDVEEAVGRISFDIEGFDENIAFMTTQDYNSGSGRGVFKTENGGDTWVQKFNNIAGGVWIKFFNDQEGFVINRDLIATTQDGGESWQIVPAVNIPSFQSSEFTILSSGNNSCQVIGNHIWFGTNKGRIYKSKDKGFTWEVFDTSLGNDALILSFAFRDTLNGIALSPTTFTSFAATNDGGETWNNVSSSPTISITNIEYVPQTDSVLIGTSDAFISANNRVSVYSKNFGKNWETINTSIPLSGIEFIAPNIGWTSRAVITSSTQAAMYKWDGDTFVSLNEPQVGLDSKIFPNPFKDNVHIQASKALKTYHLASIDGSILQSGKLSNRSDVHLNVQHLPLGVYVLEMIFEDETKISKKIFKVN